MKTFLPPNKFYSAADVPSAAGSAAATPCPQPRAAAVPFSDDENGQGVAATDSCQEPVAADLIPCAGAKPVTSQADHDGEVLGRTGSSILPTGASDLLQALGALSGTDLIHEIFAVKPKHFKLKHKRRLKLPPFAPDYEAMEVAMHDRNAPRLRADDPIWADPAPIFLRDA